MTRPLIIVIDESVIILEFMQVLLNSEGYTVIGCYPGATNVAYVRHLLPHLIILEMQRKRVAHATAFIEQTREDYTTSGIPIMVMSTDTGLLKASAPFLQRYSCISVDKPFSADWLLETVHQLINVPVP
jgi:CheY-like chemotaxis protein